MRGVIDDLVGDVTRNSISSSDYCAGIVAEYGSAASDYMRCVFLHAREFKKCRSCSEIYVVADDMYRNITEVGYRFNWDRALCISSISIGTLAGKCCNCELRTCSRSLRDG